MAVGPKNDYTKYSEARGLCFIEPIGPRVEINDDLTEQVKILAAAFKDSRYAYKGVHFCSCGIHSDNLDHFYPSEANPTHITHSLLVHYVQFHRSEIPEEELSEIKRLLEGLNERTK